ncbi:MAG: TetR/AcrR family transcriptional regulator [Actinomycetia bacterium]|nr:TetR/AcrR family transcriptional regulator [Actinomycetes bacterium]MCP5034074.1 TetR/AcrR family transcriptional regulator [Actinomycetes bacterium]
MGRHPKFTDDEVLDRAMRVLWRRGPAAVSVRDLEVALEMKAPSIYRRFGSMDRLRLAVLDHYIDRVVAPRVAKILDGSGDPVTNITLFLEQSVTEGRDGGGLIGCLVTTAGIEHGGNGSPELRSTLDQGRARIEDGIAREVQRANDLGLLAPHVNVESTVAVLTLSAQGLMAMARAGVESAELRSRARATVAAIVGPDAERGTTSPPKAEGV